jgi:hypothetical protein
VLLLVLVLLVLLLVMVLVVLVAGGGVGQLVAGLLGRLLGGLLGGLLGREGDGCRERGSRGFDRGLGRGLGGVVGGAVGRRQGRKRGQRGEPRCSTWPLAGLGVDLGEVAEVVGVGGRGGLWGCWGLLWGGVGGRIGPGERRGGGVPVGSAYAKTTSKKPRQATKSKLHADSDCFTCTRATRANSNRHSPIRERSLGPKKMAT